MSRIFNDEEMAAVATIAILDSLRRSGHYKGVMALVAEENRKVVASVENYGQILRGDLTRGPLG